MYVMTPSRVWREAERSLIFKARNPKEPNADYGVSRHTVEIPFWRAPMLDDSKKFVVSAKPGDRLILEPTVDVTVVKRLIDVEVNKALADCGIVSACRRFRDGEKVSRIVWECTTALDLAKLAWLYEIYIHDQAIK